MIYRLYKLFHVAQPRWLMPILLLAFLPWVQAAPPQTPAGTAIELPQLPSKHEMFSDTWDENGCEIHEEPTPGVPPCQALARMAAKAKAQQPIPALTPEQQNEFKSLRGFEGPYYTPQPSANAVVVLPETITTSVPPGGGFSTVGLIRNETATQLIGSVTITGELVNASGKIIGKATTEAMVSPIRPGEPAPFQLTASIPFKDVADIRWSVKWSIEPNKAKEEYRNVKAGGLNHGPESWGERKTGPTEWDTTQKPPYPYLDEGTVENLSEVDIPNPKMIVAWYVDAKGSSGKIISVMTMPLYELGGSQPAPILVGSSPYTHVANSSLSYAILIKDRNFAERVDAWEVKKMFWVTGD